MARFNAFPLFKGYVPVRDFRQNRFWLNPNLQIHGTGPGADAIIVSREARHFRLEGLAMQVLDSLDDQPRGIHWIASRVLQSTNPESSERVYLAVCRLQERGLVYSDWPARRDGSTDVLPEPKRPHSLDFIWRQRVLPPGVVAWAARPLVYLLNDRAMMVGTPLMILLQFWFLIAHPVLLHPGIYISRLDGQSFAILAAANYTALFLHELGHAAGCLRTKVKNGAIGICIYIMFPGLYTEVTESWKLSGRKRLIVDSAGIFISLCAATLALAIYLRTGNIIAGIMVLLCDITIAVNINPFVRMDGYWILSDLLEMPHLMDVNKAVTSALVGRLVFRQKLAMPKIPQNFRWSTQVYYVYYASFACVILYFAGITGVRGIPYLAHNYPQVVSTTLHAVVVSPNSWHTLKMIFGCLMATVSIVSLLLVIWRFATFLARQITTIRAVEIGSNAVAAKRAEQAV
jgi:hypothetical protein